MGFPKIFKNTIVFLIIFAWVFTSTPSIWQIGNWRIFKEIREVNAADDSGTNTVDPTTASANASGKTFDFILSLCYPVKSEIC